jgi:hypothetical protein
MENIGKKFLWTILAIVTSPNKCALVRRRNNPVEGNHFGNKMNLFSGDSVVKNYKKIKKAKRLSTRRFVCRQTFCLFILLSFSSNIDLDSFKA